MRSWTAKKQGINSNILKIVFDEKKVIILNKEPQISVIVEDI